MAYVIGILSHDAYSSGGRRGQESPGVPALGSSALVPRACAPEPSKSSGTVAPKPFEKRPKLAGNKTALFLRLVRGLEVKPRLPLKLWVIPLVQCLWDLEFRIGQRRQTQAGGDRPRDSPR